MKTRAVTLILGANNKLVEDKEILDVKQPAIFRAIPDFLKIAALQSDVESMRKAFSLLPWPLTR